MARSSQDASAPTTRRKTTRIDAKDQFLYPTARQTTRTTAMDMQQDHNKRERPVSFDSRDARHVNRPRYSDSVIPLKDGSSSSHQYTRGAQGQPNDRRLPMSRNLQPQRSLSNMFEEPLTNQAASAAHRLNNTDKGIYGKSGARPRSLSDTSLYSRPDQGDFEMMTRKSQIDDDELTDYHNGDNCPPELDGKTLLDTTTKQAEKTGGQIGSDDDDVGNATISLTEFARLEKRVPLNHVEVKEKTLVELAEPLIQDVTHIYENEWDQAIANEEKLYKQTAMSLGALLDGEMMEAAYGIKKDTEKCTKVRDAVKDAVVAEALAAKTAMLVLMAEQKKLLLELKKVEERVSKRDDSILQDLRNIHERSLNEQKKIEDEYTARADTLEDRIESMKKKGLQKDFDIYVNKFMQASRSNSIEKESTTARRRS